MRLLLVLMVSLIGGLAWAQAKRTAAPPAEKVPYIYAGAYYHEIVLSGTQAEFTNGQETKASTEKISRISIDADYRYQVFKAVQAGVLLGFQSVSGASTSYSCLNAFGTLTYNFSEAWNISDSLYSTGALGLADENCGLKDSAKKTAFSVSIGKRFKLFEHVHYMPELGGRKVGDNDAVLFAKLINFSLAW